MKVKVSRRNHLQATREKLFMDAVVVGRRACRRHVENISLEIRIFGEAIDGFPSNGIETI